MCNGARTYSARRACQCSVRFNPLVAQLSAILQTLIKYYHVDQRQPASRAMNTHSQVPEKVRLLLQAMLLLLVSGLVLHLTMKYD